MSEPLSNEEITKFQGMYCHFHNLDVVSVPNDVIQRLIATIAERDKRIAELEAASLHTLVACRVCKRGWTPQDMVDWMCPLYVAEQLTIAKGET